MDPIVEWAYAKQLDASKTAGSESTNPPMYG
jgi:hypothetical protein